MSDDLLRRSRKRIQAAYQKDNLGRPQDDGRPPLTTSQRRAANLLDPRVSLPLQATIVDQRTGRRTRYDPDSICPKLHNQLLWYFGEGPRDVDGMAKWSITVGPRQSGKSLCNALCVDNVAAQLEGQTALIIADHDKRAKTLFRYVALSHQNRPRRLRPATVPVRETNQITYDHPEGVSRVRCLSGQNANTGIGLSPDVTQISEVPFIPDFGSFWFNFYPAMVNRAEARLSLEATPAPMTEPSSEEFKNLCADARKGHGRWLFTFVAFYETRLNERKWDPAWTLDAEEQKLLDKFGPGGAHPQIGGRWADMPVSNPGEVRYLTLENLAFRRQTIRDVSEIRRWPDLFFVFYPVDPISCWAMRGGGVIPSDVLEKHQRRIVVPWLPHETYKVYRKPNPGANYVIAADPAGYGHDHASFQVLEVWRDAVYQAAVFACPNVTPNNFSDKIVEVAKQYNQALIGVERNGVGLAVLAILERALERGEIQNLYYDKRGTKVKPGWHASKQSIEESLGALIDELQERLWLFDSETVAQLADYRNDKLVKQADSRQILEPGNVGKGRRTKGHYDRASALALGCLLVQHTRAPKRPAHVVAATDSPTAALKLQDQRPLTWEEREELRRLAERDKKMRARTAKRVRRRRGLRAPRKRKT